MADDNMTQRAAAQRQKTAQKQEGDRANQLMWISRLCGIVCFAAVGSSAMLSLILLHLSIEVEANSFLVAAPTFSENLAYFEPLHPDMPKMDNLAEMFVRQYVVARHSMVANKREMNVAWSDSGVVSRMSSPAVFSRFYSTTAKPFLNRDIVSPVTTEVDMKRIIKDGWNNWQVFFDTRTVEKPDDEPEIKSWIATIQFRYYPSRIIMHNRLRNPLGFTVVQYNVAEQRR